MTPDPAATVIERLSRWMLQERVGEFVAEVTVLARLCPAMSPWLAPPACAGTYGLWATF